MQIEVTTRSRLSRGGPELVMKIAIIPRGGANRSKAEKLAQAVKRHKELKPFMKRVIVGSSSVTVYFVASMHLARAFDEILERAKDQDKASTTLPLFGNLAIG